MATYNYIRGRWNLNGLRTRPQAVAWANNYGTLDEQVYVTYGT